MRSSFLKKIVDDAFCMQSKCVMMCVCVCVIPKNNNLQVGDILRLQNSQSCGWFFDGFGRICSNQSSQKTLSVGGGIFQPTYMCHIWCYPYQYLFIQFSVASDLNLRFALSPPSGYIIIQNLHIKSTLEVCCTLILNSKSYDYITYFPTHPLLYTYLNNPKSMPPPSSSSSTFSQHSASSCASWACNGCPTSMSRSRQKAEDSCGKICKAVSGGTWWNEGWTVESFGEGEGHNIQFGIQ